MRRTRYYRIKILKNKTNSKRMSLDVKPRKARKIRRVLSSNGKIIIVGDDNSKDGKD